MERLRPGSVSRERRAAFKFRGYHKRAIPMTPDRLRQIEELYHSVREASPGMRAALLEQSDPELRREVESLLARQNDSLMLDRFPQMPGDPTMTMLNPGARLGPY